MKLAAIIIGVCFIVSSAAFTIGRTAGREFERAAQLTVAKESEAGERYVGALMRPLWTDFCRAHPERCEPAK